MTAATATTRNLPGYGETANPRVIAREFARALADHGFTPSPALVRTLANRFLADGFTSPADVDAFVLWYSDPTGEAAVRLAMRRAPRTPNTDGPLGAVADELVALLAAVDLIAR